MMKYMYALLDIGKDGKVLHSEGGDITGFKLEGMSETTALNKLGDQGFQIYDTDKHVDGGRTVRLSADIPS